jgi:hypothetical protein
MHKWINVSPVILRSNCVDVDVVVIFLLLVVVVDIRRRCALTQFRLPRARSSVEGSDRSWEEDRFGNQVVATLVGDFVVGTDEAIDVAENI